MAQHTSSVGTTLHANHDAAMPQRDSQRDRPFEVRTKVLVVDDLLENLRLLANLLTEDGYEVKKTPDGAMALSNVPRFEPDVILLDIMMPEMDGYTVCRQLKANPQTRDIPVIFLSALDLTFDKIKAFEVGAADYIHKPFHPAEVLARVKNQVRVRQQRLQLQAQSDIIEAQRQQIEDLFAARKIAEDKLAAAIQEKL